MPLTTVNPALLDTQAQYTGFKNRIINGAMVIAQRSTSSAVTGGGYFVLDRYRWSQDGSYGFTITPTISQDSSTPSSFVGNSMKFTNGTGAAPSAGQTAVIEQYIEGFNTADLAFGTASASTVTLSFWVRASVTGTYCVSFRNSASSRSMVREYTISVANTWEYKTITIAGDTTGTWIGATNGIGLTLSFTLGSGSTYETPAGTWTAGYYVATSSQTDLTATTGATWFITGVQLEKGSTATSFDYRAYGTELALCYRYAWNFSSALSSNGAFLRYLTTRNTSTTAVAGTLILPVEMRVTPTLTTTGTASNYAVIHTGGTTACSAVPAIGGDGSSRFSVNLEASVSSGLTSGQGSQLMSNNNQTSYLLFAAEL
jgi:hypothetical protein